VGQRRQDDNVRIGRFPANAAPTEYATALAMHIQGARTELAGKLYLDPVHWNALLQYIHGKPDYTDYVINIDAKSRWQRHHSLIVQLDDPDDWYYLLICGALHPDYEIVGWLKGNEAKREENKADPVGGRPAYFCKGPFHHPAKLKAMLKPVAYEPLPKPPARVTPIRRRALVQAPDLQQWVAKYGGYQNIPWEQWDAATRRYQTERRF